MSIFNELLPKIHEISKTFTKNFNDDLQATFECFDKFEVEYQNAKSKARDKASKDKNPMTTLQSIHEDDDETNKQSETDSTKRSSTKSDDVVSISTRSSTENNTEKPRRKSKKRSKNEVDGLFSPEQDKRQKRNASVKAQSVISKQVNVNLTQKLRREDIPKLQSSRSQQHKEENKENSEPPLNIQIKQEKISLPPEPMDMETLLLDVEVKQEQNKDEIAMPPPMAPIPRPRKGATKEKVEKEENSGSEGETSGKQRTTRTRKQTDSASVPASRSTRSSSRSVRATAEQEPPAEAPPADVRPKRTRAKKKASEVPTPEPERETPTPQESVAASPTEKPRPKRTRKAQKEKAVEKPAPSPQEEAPQPDPVIPAEGEPVTQTDNSPILQKGKHNLTNEAIKSKIDANDTKDSVKTQKGHEEISSKPELERDLKADVIKSKFDDLEVKQTGKGKKNVTNGVIQADSFDTPDCKTAALDETRVISKDIGQMDQTMVLPNGVYNHAPVTPKKVRNMNETVVLEAAHETTVYDKQPTRPKPIMDATVVLDKAPTPANLTDDNSLLTDDSDAADTHTHTPTKQHVPPAQPASAVKEKVQQFEELASRVTRTKTRAMAKKEEQPESHTPPDKIVKQIISVDTLNKMNNMIFNGKAPQISSSATKPRSQLPKPAVPASASKLSGINRAREAAEENLKREKEDARKKKEAILEAKKEMQKKKREDKMAAAAAAREAAERDRRAAMQAAARERLEKQAHADLGKLERLREVERRKMELARKAAETEERRRAEEQARQQRLAEDQRRADAARQKQLEEAEAMKKEAAIMAKEIEKRQKEYIEKQRKQRLEDKTHTPLRTPGTPGGYLPCAMEPVYMADGFQYLNSDEDEEPVERPAPVWSTSKARKQQLYIQAQLSQVHIDRLFSVRVHSPDLREIFPNIERTRLKRTSSAVWRTPPNRLPALTE